MNREPRWSPGIFATFEVAFRPYMKRCLNNIYVRGKGHVPQNTTVLILANHVSWWDGFLLREIHRRIDKDAPYWSLARQKLLEDNPFLAHIGVVGFDESSTASLRKLKAFIESRSLAQGEWFVLYPQGEIWPSTLRPLGFRKGAAWMASLLKNATTLPVGIHLEALNQRKPSAFISIGQPVVDAATIGVRGLELAVEKQLDYISNALQREGEQSFAYWKKHHHQLWT